MKIASFSQDLVFNEDRITPTVIMETSFTKEIRIVFKKGQVMKEHKAAFPIVVHILEGHIDFGVEGTIHSMEKGSVITLDGNVPHNLTAKEDSIVRLTLSKLDTSERVEKVVQNS